MKLLGKVRDFVSANAVTGNAAEEEAKLRKVSPDLLGADEKVIFAFLGRGGSGRDAYYFTSTRFLIRDVCGITGKKVKYQSRPYSIIKSWSVSTAGGGFDSDSECHIWASGMEMFEIEFSKDKVDLFALQQFLNAKCLPEEQVYPVDIPANVQPGGKFQATLGGVSVEVTCPAHLGPGMRMEVKVPSTNPYSYSDGHLSSATKTGITDFLNWLGDDSKQVDPRELETRLRTAPAVLAPDERVEMAFKCGRDYALLSSKRFLLIDKRGATGKKVVYLSILWTCFRAFAVETAGHFDLDAELYLWTNMKEENRKVIQIDLRKGQCDPLAVQRFFSDKILGMDTKPPTAGHVDAMSGKKDTGASLLAFAGDDYRQIDASVVDAQFHSNPPILQGCEKCEMAFKGRRDLVIFTNKRIIDIDVQGFTGHKKMYRSIPWSTVKVFGVRSAGTMLDKDSEMMIWTDIMFDPPPPGQEDPPPPQPGMSYLEWDFQKDKIDLMAVNRYLSARCLSKAHHIPVPASVMAAAPAGGLEKFLGWLGNDAIQMDAGAMQAQLLAAGLLLPDENVAMAFKTGRDSYVLTDKRVFIVDVQGMTGKRIQYYSIPYSSIRAFKIESAGSFDRDAEVDIYTRNLWNMSCFHQDFRSTKCDILAVHSYLSDHVVGTFDPSLALAGKSYPGASPGAFDGALSWLGDDAHQIDAAAVNQRFHAEIPLLLKDEKAELAFKCGRDVYVHTNKRVLFIDVQGWSGKKVSYYSCPLKYCTGFEVATAGTLDRDCEVVVYCDVPGHPEMSQDMRDGKVDLFAIQKALATKLTISK